MKASGLLIIFLFLSLPLLSQSRIAAGGQPQISRDLNGVIRLVFGEKEKIFYCLSTDEGRSFSEPVLVDEVPGMHLGMTRGPQLAVSRDFSVITAMDNKGDIHSYKLAHKNGKWQKIARVNDQDGSAPEGLMSIAADDRNNFFAVWLDLREGRKNNICFATLKGKAWSENYFVYRSPESHVCECCKPSIAVNGNNISIMFRNWLGGSRDMYLTSSSDGGRTFTKAEKLGNGTWVLKGCPMDGGGLTIDESNNVHTAWQRERQVFYALPGQPEQKIGDGRSVGMMEGLITWENGSSLMLRRLMGSKYTVGEGTALKVCLLSDNTILAVWQKDGEIVFKKISG